MPTLYIKAPLACLEPGAAGGIMVKDGRIAELVAAGGAYAELWASWHGGGR